MPLLSTSINLRPDSDKVKVSGVARNEAREKAFVNYFNATIQIAQRSCIHSAMRSPNSSVSNCSKHLKLAVDLFWILLLSITLVTATVQTKLCDPQSNVVTIPIHVRLLIVGNPPLFMRKSSWTPTAKRNFLKRLSSTERHAAIPFEEDENFIYSHSTRTNPTSCSVVEYSYMYDTALASEKTLSNLDAVLSAIQKKSFSVFVNGTEVADEFWTTLQSEVNFRPSNHSYIYNVLLYRARSVNGRYGFQAEKGTRAGAIGLASEHRFAVIDIDTEPFFLEQPVAPSPGEMLLANSNSPAGYATELRSIVSKLLTPVPSVRMRRFPQETKLTFKLNVLDASEVIGRMAGVGGDSKGNKPLGASFSTELFMRVLTTIFHNHILPPKEISISVQVADMFQNSKMAMAISRSFSTRGLELVLDSERLINDLLSETSEANGYFVDSSFVAHIPMFLFSFADDSRTTHFESGSEVRAKVVAKQVVVMIENRLQDEKHNSPSATSEAVKDVLELLCGIDEPTSVLMSTQSGAVPLVVRDIARRNIITQELDWSQATAAKKAEELLNFEGLDSNLIPHEKGSYVELSRRDIEESLRMLQEAWRRAATAMSLENVESTASSLSKKCRKFADILHREVCEQPLPEEILLKVKADVRSMKTITVASRRRQSTAICVLLSTIAGVAIGAYLHRQAVNKSISSGTHVGDNSVEQTIRQFDVSATTQWFSTLSSSYKSKTH